MKKRRILFIIVIVALLIGRGVYLAKKPMAMSHIANFRETLDIKSIEILIPDAEDEIEGSWFIQGFYTKDATVIQEIYKNTLEQKLTPVYYDNVFEWASPKTTKIIFNVEGRSPIDFTLDGERISLRAYSTSDKAEIYCFEISQDYYDFMLSYVDKK